jgi:predicted amidohydrolase
MDGCRAAVVQMASGPDKQANLERAAALVRRVAAGGARLVALPELFTWRGARGYEVAEAEPIPGPTTEAMGRLARECAVVLCAGSVLEAVPGQARLHNTACLFGPDGSLLATYRKIHLFDVALAGRVAARESDAYTAGERVVVADTAHGRIGLAVCYDLRFPELFRRLVVAGAEILVVPSAFTAPTGEAHWELLCRARAVENQCFLLAPDQTGPTTRGYAHHGHSLIVDPWGTVLARAGTDEEVVVADLDPAALARVRHEMPCLSHARLL